VSQVVNIHLVPGDVAPRYDSPIEEIKLEHVTITEQGTQSHLPMLDFVMTGADGKRYLMVITGRIANSISAAVKGVNMRNHGTPEP